MQHLDEHTLAFYAMGVEYPSSERDAIEAHLAECCGCRAQVEELRGIDQHVAQTTDSAEQSEDLPSNAVVTLPRAIKRHPNAPPVWLESRSLARGARFKALVRRHPLAAGSAGLVLAFLVFFSIRTVSDWVRPTGQPLFVRLNRLGTALEVCGKNEVLFDIPVSLTDASESERQRQENTCTRITDLDGDRNMEVVTGAPYQEGEKLVWNALRTFNNDGQLRAVRHLGTPVRYRGVDYTGSYGILSVVITSPAGSAGKEILVGINNDRSPWCLMRLDKEGRTLGEFWHFGWLWGIAIVNLEGAAQEFVVLSGANNVEYRSNLNYPVLTVLDPAGIKGSTESECTRGFGFPASDAQLYYIRSGNVNPALISGVKVENPSFGNYVKVRADSSLYVSEVFDVPNNFPEIIYTFDKHLDLKDVWMSDGPRITLREKFLAKKTPAGFDEFMNDLKSKVQYWDGSQWKNERTMVIRLSPPI